ncbi:hypothetical protein [Gymnodinialimonas sp. 57CJ19]|uniref:hypothetical protein n=1 Tax=Gymnodinialimonas sp. 57CJ19 TaxID=3138498 RepID=UPI0031344FFE
MFTIEHEFDATVVTLVDEGELPLQEDVIVSAFDECVTLQQVDPRSDQVRTITLSLDQVRDLAAALDLPEGAYQLARDQT